MNTALDEVVKGLKDINTALRDAEQKINKQIEEKEVAKGNK
jgi:maltose-binding protein MalE